MIVTITQLAALDVGEIFRPVPDTLTAGLIGENTFLRKRRHDQETVVLGLNGWLTTDEPPVELPEWELVRCAVAEPGEA